MAKLSGKEIQKLARSIVAENPGGIRYSVLVDTISQQNPETPKNTVHGSVWNLDTIFPNEITKPSRGLFTPITKSGNEAGVPESTEQIAPTGIKIKESEFYAPFAEWLKNDLDEVTEVVSLGGAGLKSKWGTPDVVGIYKPQDPSSLVSSLAKPTRLSILRHAAKGLPWGSGDLPSHLVNSRLRDAMSQAHLDCGTEVDWKKAVSTALKGIGAKSRKFRSPSGRLIWAWSLMNKQPQDREQPQAVHSNVVNFTGENMDLAAFGSERPTGNPSS